MALRHKYIIYLFLSALLLLNKVECGDSFTGLAYTPFRTYGHCPNDMEMEHDLTVLRMLTNSVRIYSTECMTLMEKLLASAMEILLGVWIDGNSNDRVELDRLYDVLKKYPNANIGGIAVGNEVLYRKTLSPNQLADYVKEVKSKVMEIADATNSDRLRNVPVYSVDVCPDPAVVEVSDAVGINVHPFYDKNVPMLEDPSQMAEAAFIGAQHRIKEVEELCKGKRIFVTETGWPTSSGSNEIHIGSPQVQKEYFEKFSKWATAENRKYWWFEVFDSPWKQQMFPAEAEHMSEFHWGLHFDDRSSEKEILG